jgi:hypothetical protein
MKPFWKIALAVLCVVVLGGAAITWQVHESRLKEAARVCRVSAEQGDAKAQAKLGSMYFHGRGVPKDYGATLLWYRKSADQGEASGENGLGYLYFHGQGVEQDYAEAFSWWQMAANQGYAKAQTNLGDMYYYGHEVPQNNAEAARWYRKAADQGYALAQYNLGYMYSFGYGVPQDRAEAESWFHKAADHGDEYAQRALGLKGQRLSTLGIINHPIIPFGCLLLLVGSLEPGWRLKNPHLRALPLAALLGLTTEAMSLYWVFGALPSLSAVYVLFFVKSLLAGIVVAMLISIFFPESAKIALGIIGILFICLNLLLLLFALHLSKHPIPIRPFCMLNGHLIGLSIPLAIYLWRRPNRTNDEQIGDCEESATEATDEGGDQLDESSPPFRP